MRSVIMYCCIFFPLLSLTMFSLWLKMDNIKYIFRPNYQISLKWSRSQGNYNQIPTIFTSNSSHLRRVILLWTPFFSDREWWSISLKKLKCPVSDCEVTSKRSRFNESQVVVFHWRDIKLFDLPKYHPHFQRWILFNMESPFHTPANVLQALGDNVNWTATYRIDSDVLVLYGRFLPKIRNRTVNSNMSSSGVDYTSKTAVVSWLVSNCHTPSNREGFVKELQKFIKVDVYGRCGQQMCNLNSRAECYSALAKKHLFYLSFENSLCEDYITEKLYLALQRGLIPVVFGGANYSSILPANSYIDALNFSSPKHLANFLIKVSQSKELYNSYHEWKQQYEVEMLSHSWFCDLCKKLHNSDEENKNYQSYGLHKWWFEKADCKSWKKDTLTGGNVLINDS